MSTPRKSLKIERAHLVALIAIAIALVAALMILTLFASSPGWLLLYPLLITALLGVSGLIVVALLRRV